MSGPVRPSKDGRRARINPKPPKGVTDSLPSEERLRQRVLAILGEVSDRFGFEAVAAPAVLTADQLHRRAPRGRGDAVLGVPAAFRFTAKGGHEVGLRFDLTVPLARLIAFHRPNLMLPLRFVQHGTIWRDEAHREQVHWDTDIIGAKSQLADAEILMFQRDALAELAGPTGPLSVLEHMDIQLLINDRRVLVGYLQALGLEEHLHVVRQALDGSCAHSGPAAFVRSKLLEVGANVAGSSMGIVRIDDLVQTFVPAESDSSRQVLTRLRTRIAALPLGSGRGQALAGLENLEGVLGLVEARGRGRITFHVQLSLQRALTYYTTTVMLARAGGHAMLPLGAGGRYDDMLAQFGAPAWPCVGASVYVSHLVDAELAHRAGHEPPSQAQAMHVLVLHPDQGQLLEAEAFALACDLRAGGLRAAAYPAMARRGAQIKFAYGHRIPLVAWVLAPGSFEVRVLVGEKQASLRFTDSAALVDGCLTLVRAGLATA